MAARGEAYKAGAERTCEVGQCLRVGNAEVFGVSDAAIVQSRRSSAHGLRLSRPWNSLPGHPRRLAAQPVRFPCTCTGSLLSR